MLVICGDIYLFDLCLLSAVRYLALRMYCFYSETVEDFDEQNWGSFDDDW